MYSTSYSTEKDPQAVLDFMKQHPFAMLVGSLNDIPAVTQVPLLVEERDGKLYLLGHIMRGTDHYKAFSGNPNVLCVFTGAHSYVSASWYTDQKMASTWNYMSVQARGRLSFLDDASLLDILERTTVHFENNEASPASYKNLSPDYIQHHAKAIVAFEIEVTSLKHTFKLSQNRNKESYDNIIQHLHQRDPDAQGVAREMEARKDRLFKEQ
ncbi:MAG TPA: FMN-binding negative transcriptional regulator [Chitinophagaceae bacterium]